MFSFKPDHACGVQFGECEHVGAWEYMGDAASWPEPRRPHRLPGADDAAHVAIVVASDDGLTREEREWLADAMAGGGVPAGEVAEALRTTTATALDMASAAWADLARAVGVPAAELVRRANARLRRG